MNKEKETIETTKVDAIRGNRIFCSNANELEHIDMFKSKKDVYLYFKKHADGEIFTSDNNGILFKYDTYFRKFYDKDRDDIIGTEFCNSKIIIDNETLNDISNSEPYCFTKDDTIYCFYVYNLYFFFMKYKVVNDYRKAIKIDHSGNIYLKGMDRIDKKYFLIDLIKYIYGDRAYKYALSLRKEYVDSVSLVFEYSNNSVKHMVARNANGSPLSMNIISAKNISKFLNKPDIISINYYGTSIYFRKKDIIKFSIDNEKRFLRFGRSKLLCIGAYDMNRFINGTLLELVNKYNLENEEGVSEWMLKLMLMLGE